MAYGRGVLPLTSQTSASKRAYIDARAKRLEWKRARVITEIIDFWFAMGAPALSELDAAATAIPLPADCRETLRPYWAQLLAFDIPDTDGIGVKELAKDLAKKEAARLLKRKGASAKDSDQSIPPHHKRIQDAP